MANEATSLRVPGTLDYVAQIRGWLERVLQRWHVADGISADLKLAVTELCTNIVRHGYAGDHWGNIEVSVARYGGTIQVTIDDTAPVFEPRQAVSPPLESLSEGGYGLYLVHRLMDDIVHERLSQGGNRTTPIKYEDLSARRSTLIQHDEPLWYKDAIIYQLHVRAFHDSNDDGIGDFRGLTEKLDYLQALGITTLWLLPFSRWHGDGPLVFFASSRQRPHTGHVRVRQWDASSPSSMYHPMAKGWKSLCPVAYRICFDPSFAVRSTMINSKDHAHRCT